MAKEIRLAKILSSTISSSYVKVGLQYARSKLMFNLGVSNFKLLRGPMSREYKFQRW